MRLHGYTLYLEGLLELYKPPLAVSSTRASSDGITPAPTTTTDHHLLPYSTPLQPRPQRTGALGAVFMTVLRILAKQSRLPGATDLTQYGRRAARPRRRPSR